LFRAFERAPEFLQSLWPGIGSKCVPMLLDPGNPGLQFPQQSEELVSLLGSVALHSADVSAFRPDNGLETWALVSRKDTPSAHAQRWSH